MVVGIIGSRRRNSVTDYKLVRERLLQVLEEYSVDSLVSGGCPKGGDHFAEMLAQQLNLPIKIHHADWKRYGRSAGFRRNGYIAEDADILIACVADDRTGGTEDTIRKFKKKLGFTDSKLLLV